MEDHDKKAEGPVALITGAGSGIGRATSLLLAAEGWHCALLGRTGAKLTATGEQFPTGAIPLKLTVDLGDSEAAVGAVKQVVEHFGRLDALVNVAGVAPQASIAETDAALLRSTLDQNLVSPACMLAAAWEALCASRGVVINVSSMSAIDPFPGFLAYGASKSALDSMTRSVVVEGAEHGVRAFSLNPGVVETPLLRSLFDESQVPPEMAYAPTDIALEILACMRGEREERIGATFAMVKN